MPVDEVCQPKENQYRQEYDEIPGERDRAFRDIKACCLFCQRGNPNSSVVHVIYDLMVPQEDVPEDPEIEIRWLD